MPLLPLCLTVISFLENLIIRFVSGAYSFWMKSIKGYEIVYRFNKGRLVVRVSVAVVFNVKSDNKQIGVMYAIGDQRWGGTPILEGSRERSCD